MVHGGSWVISCSNQHWMKNPEAEPAQGGSRCLTLVLEQEVGHSLWEEAREFGSESGCLAWQGGYRLHDLKQAFAPFSALFFLSRLCVPWGQNPLLYLYSFPQYSGKIVSNPQKTANELCVVRTSE